MKYLLIVIVVAIVLINLGNQRESSLLAIPSPSSQISTYVPIKLTYKDRTYHIYIEKITVPEQLLLIANFDAKKFAQVLYEEHNCQIGINGGFYTTENTPLGLFYTDSYWINQTTHSASLFNGFVSGGLDGSVVLATNPETAGTARFIFQSGPLFTPSTKLSIINDEPERRALIGQTTAKETYILLITEEKNTFGGPLLAELPALIGIYNDKADEPLQTLVNLDGGSASTFINSEVAIEELTPIGSFLCMKKNP